MYKVILSTDVYNGKRTLPESQKGKWNIGEAKKHAIMVIKRHVWFELEYENEEEYLADRENAIEEFRRGIETLGNCGDKLCFKESFPDSPNKKNALPPEPEPMTWRKWHSERIKK